MAPTRNRVPIDGWFGGWAGELVDYCLLLAKCAFPRVRTAEPPAKPNFSAMKQRRHSCPRRRDEAVPPGQVPQAIAPAAAEMLPVSNASIGSEPQPDPRAATP